MKKILLLLILLSWGTLAPATESPLVVVSIKPLHSLVAGVMQGVAQPQLLVKGGGSPHGYALRPSEARQLAQADLVVWVGHQLESFLEKPLVTLGREARQLELITALQDQLLPLRAGGNWEQAAHGHAEHHDHTEHSEQRLNPHLWLNPRLAQQVVAQVVTALVAIDSAHQQQYQQNANQLNDRLDQLDRRLTTKLAPVKSVPYVVFHDAYQYFEAAYGLNAVGSITVDPERKPGIRRLLEMREKIRNLDARCVFSEPQFEPKLVATIIEGSQARTGVLDPLGADLPAGPDSYFLLMNRLADNLVTGLR